MLVEKHYLRAIPVDPMSQSADSWVVLHAEDPEDTGIKDVHSGAAGTEQPGPAVCDLVEAAATGPTPQQRGFTYFGVLVLVVLIGLMLAAAGEVASQQAQREREAELLFVGHQYRDAIERYFPFNHRFPTRSTIW